MLGILYKFDNNLLVDISEILVIEFVFLFICNLSIL